MDFSSAIGGVPFLGDIWNGIKPADTTGVQQAADDARNLQNQFVQQMNQQQATPGLSYAGSAPTVAANPGYAPGTATYGAGQPGGAGQGPGQMLVPTAAPGTGGVARFMGSMGSAAGAPQPTVNQQIQGLAGNGGGVNVAQAAAGFQGNPSQIAAPSLGGGGGGGGGGPQVTSISTNPILTPPPGQPPPNPSWNGVPQPPGTVAPPPSSTPSGRPEPVPGTAGTERGQPIPWNTTSVPSGATGFSAPAPGTPASAPGMMAATMQAAPNINAAQINQAPQDQFRQGQVGLAQNLADTIQGKTPSVAQLQQQQAFAQQQAQQMGMAAAMGRGGNQALAMRSAMGNMGALGAQQAAASALQRAQETAMAQAQMGNVLGQGRGSDIGLAQSQAGLTQQANLQNQANVQQAGAQNATMLQQANANNQQSQIGTRGQNINEQSNRANQALQANQNQVNAQVGSLAAQNQHQQQNANLLSTGLGLLSDERQKKNIRPPGPNDMRDFLAAMHPGRYEYKGSTLPKVGVMAQDVEASDVGRTLVRNTPAGKAIHVPDATGALLAAVADLHKRIEAVEGKRGKKAA